MKDFTPPSIAKPTHTTLACGGTVRAGTRVRLHPKATADAFDLMLRGQSAIVESIEQDFDGKTLLTVTLPDDPGRDLGVAGKPGHRFFFQPDEVELEGSPTEMDPTTDSGRSGRPVLVAGIGNIFLGDDGFGVEVVRRLKERPLPVDARVVDFGIRGVDLAFALLEDISAAILVDATPRGGGAGTLYVIEPTLPEVPEHAPFPQGHEATPDHVIRWAHSVGGKLPPIQIVGCEPESIEPSHDLESGLSKTVADSVEPAIDLILGLLKERMKSAH